MDPTSETEPAGTRNGAATLDLVLNLAGFEGPIDLLLALAREQKVDLTRISILQLAEQYLAFIAEAKRLRLEVAADYLVMAAWLAYLKSRLLLPEPPEPEVKPSAAEMAASLQFQLRRLEAMQQAGVRLLARAQLGRDVFSRGAPEGLRVARKPVWQVALFDLLKAYAAHYASKERGMLRIEPTALFSMELALERLSSMLGRMPDWTVLQAFLPPGLAGGLVSRSATASMLAAGLELVRTGRIQVRQDQAFGPIFVRRTPENNVTPLHPRPAPTNDQGSPA